MGFSRPIRATPDDNSLPNKHLHRQQRIDILSVGETVRGRNWRTKIQKQSINQSNIKDYYEQPIKPCDVF